jgi:hypothetical protein
VISRKEYQKLHFAVNGELHFAVLKNLNAPIQHLYPPPGKS